MFKESMANSLCKLLLKNETEAADRVYLRQPRDGVWSEYTWAEVMLQARKVAGFLHQLGLKRGTHISIISKNCAEWFITDFGITLAGMVNVPLYTNQVEDSIHYVLDHADVKLVFVGKLDDHQRVRSFIPSKYETVSFDYHDDLKVNYKWLDVLASQPLVDVIEPDAEDLYTIIYSSGTTGAPKGAMYTHQTIANYLTLFPKDLLRIQDLEHYNLISYLPLAHVYERTAVQLGSITLHSDVSFVESLDKFAENLRQVQPTLFTAVPRIWGVFQQKISQKVPPKKLNFLLKVPFLSTLVKNKIKAELGLSKCVNEFSGASNLPISIIEFFEKIDLFIQEGYGQTENLAYATISLLNERRNGYVGTARLEVELKEGEGKELLIKSPCLMKGYYKDKEATKHALTAEGWLRTGDLCEIDPKGRIKITGRISETYKNQTGEFVVPSPIEKRFASNSMIEQLCLVGRGLPSNVLIVALNDQVRLTNHSDEIKHSLQETLGETNSKLAKYEKISHVIIAKEAWGSNNDLLTPTLKVKRKNIEQHYAKIIERVLTEHNSVVFE